VQCNHQECTELWITENVVVWLGTYYSTLPDHVDVFIDLTTNDPGTPYIPRKLRKYLPKEEEGIYEVYWHVRDMQPGSQQLVDFVIKLIEAGLNVAFGCHGSHGRTGWLAARLAKHYAGLSGDEAVDFVRARHCVLAIESDTQLRDLGCQTSLGSKTLVLKNIMREIYK
jgi:protein-tyrosine phosphatase